MGLMLMLAAGGSGGQVLQPPVTFTQNTTWVSPTDKLESAVGRGGSGTDATSGDDGYVRTTEYKKFVNGELVENTLDYKYFIGPTPANYCTAVDRSGGIHEETCYYHQFYEGDSPATTGPSATAFDKTFPGRYGAGTAANTSYTDVPVVKGQSYNIVVPTGGQITIQYYQ